MERVEHSFKAMGGPCRLRLEAAGAAQARLAIDAAVAEVQRLERKYSRYTADSLTTAINRAAGKSVAIDAETAALLGYANTAWRESGGLFDLTSGVLRRAWNFRSGGVPAQTAIDELLPLVGWERVRWDERSVCLPAGMELDFGGCVKEYACDSAVAELRRHGIAAALVDLAGDMAALGAPSGADGWPVGIRHPGRRDAAVAVVKLPPGGLASSGDYERCVMIDGRRFGHILHPRTGWPVSGGLVAVSVLAPQCLVAGSSATIAMLRPARDAMDWLRSLGLPWLAIDTDLHCHGTLAGEGGS